MEQEEPETDQTVDLDTLKERSKTVTSKVVTKYAKDLLKSGLVSQGACPVTASYGINTVFDYTKTTLEKKDNPSFDPNAAMSNSVLIGTGATVGGLIGSAAGAVICGPVCAFVGGAIGGTIGSERVKRSLQQIQSDNLTASTGNRPRNHTALEFTF